MDRRAFLERALAGGAVPAALALLLEGCAAEERSGAGGPAEAGGALRSGGDGRGADPLTLERPLLQPWPGRGVLVSMPPAGLPVAYVSMADRAVFVDPRLRSRAQGALGAHISVSTGHWRLHLPGDDRRVPVSPGDSLREFEEHDVNRWDPRAAPAPGDVRVRLGMPRPVRLEFACLAAPGDAERYTGGPLDYRACVEDGGERPCREELQRIGTATRHPRAACDDAGAPVDVFAWVCPADEARPPVG